MSNDFKSEDVEKLDMPAGAKSIPINIRADGR
jgi:hypothetical protein